MAKEYVFSPARYFMNTWYKYIALWIGISLAFCVLMAANATLTLITAIAVVSFFGVVAVLLLLNRIRTWKKSKLKVSENRIDLVLFLQNGYEAHIELGQRRKIRTFTVIRPARVYESAKSIVVNGQITCIDDKYDSGTNSRKEKGLSSFKIPPYFSEWENAKKELLALNGGC